MGFLDFFKTKDINKGVEEYKSTNDAILLDVRTPEEYFDGHIENSVNIPLQEIDKIVKIIQNKEVPLFVHCRSGARSSQAVGILKRMGYANVNDIGGILGYRGAIVK